MSFFILVRQIIAAIMSISIAVGLPFGTNIVQTPAYPTVSQTTTSGRDVSADTPLADSILLANRMKNGVQCAYANTASSFCRMANQNAVLTHALDPYGNGATLSTLSGLDAVCAGLRKRARRLRRFL